MFTLLVIHVPVLGDVRPPCAHYVLVELFCLLRVKVLQIGIELALIPTMGMFLSVTWDRAGALVALVVVP